VLRTHNNAGRDCLKMTRPKRGILPVPSAARRSAAARDTETSAPSCGRCGLSSRSFADAFGHQLGRRADLMCASINQFGFTAVAIEDADRGHGVISRPNDIVIAIADHDCALLISA
jgi:hypothetical protein